MTISDLPPLHDDLTFLTAMSEDRAARLVRWLARGLVDGGTVADAGCGWGELLLRVARAAPQARAVGVDLDEVGIAEAGRRAEERGLAERVTFTVGDASTALPDGLDALVTIGASQIWGEETDEPGPMPYAAALGAMRASVRRGARVVYGEGIWSRPPTAEAIAPLGGREDELVSLADLADLAVEHGFAVVAVQEASLEEFDEFESGFCAGYASWLAEHPADHPEAEEVRRRADRQRTAYLRGYRGLMGLAYLQLLAV